MKRVKAGIALITMFGLLLGTASVFSTKTAYPVYRTRSSQTLAKITHYPAKSSGVSYLNQKSPPTISGKEGFRRVLIYATGGTSTGGTAFCTTSANCCVKSFTA